MIKSIAAAAALTAIAAATVPAAAAPTPRTDILTATPLIDVQYRDHDRRRYRPGHRYDAPPPRWRRYDRRPYDWRRRGCIIVGPLWFCP